MFIDLLFEIGVRPNSIDRPAAYPLPLQEKRWRTSLCGCLCFLRTWRRLWSSCSTRQRMCQDIRSKKKNPQVFPVICRVFIRYVAIVGAYEYHPHIKKCVSAAKDRIRQSYITRPLYKRLSVRTLVLGETAGGAA